MLDLIHLEIDKHKTAQYPMIEHQIDAIMGIVQGYAILAPDKSEALPKFQKELLQMIAE